jgi:hypothetical protein
MALNEEVNITTDDVEDLDVVYNSEFHGEDAVQVDVDENEIDEDY